MTTHDTPDPTDAAPDATDVPPWSLDEGPLADALLAVDRAVAGIETAKATLTARRHDFACTFRELVADHVDDDSLAEDLHRVIRALYWEYGTLRLTDLSAATGLDNDRLRRIAGPQVVDVACVGCGAPTDVLQTSRSQRPAGRCPDCRQSVFDPFDDAFDLPGPVDPPGPSVRGPVDVDWLDRLLDHLAARVPTEGCDNRLTLTQQWARREGMSQDGVVDSLRDLGAYCDCEVLMNAPRSRGSGR